MSTGYGELLGPWSQKDPIFSSEGVGGQADRHPVALCYATGPNLVCFEFRSRALLKVTSTRRLPRGAVNNLHFCRATGGGTRIQT